MRCSTIYLGLVFGLLLNESICAAAGIDTFAKVNLVAGIEAGLDTGNRDAQALNVPTDPCRFYLSGPSGYNVAVQLAALEPESQWSDQALSPSINIDSRHDRHGNLNLDLPLDDLPLADDSCIHPPRYIVTLTYE